MVPSESGMLRAHVEARNAPHELHLVDLEAGA